MVWVLLLLTTIEQLLLVRLTLAKNCSSIFIGKMCVFVFHRQTCDFPAKTKSLQIGTIPGKRQGFCMWSQEHCKIFVFVAFFMNSCFSILICPCFFIFSFFIFSVFYVGHFLFFFFSCFFLFPFFFVHVFLCSFFLVFFLFFLVCVCVFFFSFFLDAQKVKNRRKVPVVK